MSAPIPTPRISNSDSKKPIPTPRKSLIQNQISTGDTPSPPLSTSGDVNTFSRRVRHLSSASKQIAGDFVEETRQSVRKFTRHFSFSQQGQPSNVTTENQDSDDVSNIDIFNNITFESPIASTSNSIYNNIDPNTSSSNDSLNLPPPAHPPPPLPDDSLYDAPQSLTSSSNSSNAINKIENYESVFPNYPYNSDSESCVDMTERCLDNRVSMNSSLSWKYYDPVPPYQHQENIYENHEITPPPRLRKSTKQSNKDVDVNSNASDDPIEPTTLERQNSLYENHDVNPNKNSRPSQSVIMQFDPLHNSGGNEIKYDMTLVEQMLIGDLYGSISNANTIDDWSISNDSESEDYANPPSPPIRVDSLPEEDTPVTSATTNPMSQSKSTWFTTTTEQQKTVTSDNNNKLKGWFKHVLEIGSRSKDSKVVERPQMGRANYVRKKGMLYKVQNGPVEDLFGEYSGRWCILENSNFICYSDSNCDNLKEHYAANNILSIQILQDSKYKYRFDNDDQLHCFELCTSGKLRGGHVYGSRNIAERRVWMQNLAESLTNRFTTKITSDYTRIGWAYVREGVSGKWAGAWVVLSHRDFHYAIDNHSVKTMDLRKARCIVLQSYQDENNPKTSDKGPNMVIDCPGMVLYLRMWTSRQTKIWLNVIKVAAHNNGANLDQQQLTKHNVPVIVERCINFIYAHGSMSEGIYRRSGTSSIVSDILMKFRKDAFSVQLTKDKCTEFEVATALKRFFRDLPEPLLGSSQRQYLYQVSKQSNKEERTRMYKAALEMLPPISYNTTKKLLGHLHFISSQSKKNLMHTDNLAAIWGPTLMHDDKSNTPTTPHENSHHQDTRVVGQLINLYRHIFPEDAEEIEKERTMLKMLERFTKSPQGVVNKKEAGDLRVWIHLNNKEGKSFNVSVGPNKTAFEVCAELRHHMTESSVEKLILEEVVLSGRLTRPIHHTEKVLDVVLRWSYWTDQDRKDNHLVVTLLSKYQDYIRNDIEPLSSELKYFDNKTRFIKTAPFEFSQAKLNLLKEKTNEIVQTWPVEDIIWYLGHESKRTPQSRYTITFIETKSHPDRTKGNSYFGYTLVWLDQNSRAKWLGVMWRARYPNNFNPPPLTEDLLHMS